MGKAMTNNHLRSIAVPLAVVVGLGVFGVLIAVYLGIAWE